MTVRARCRPVVCVVGCFKARRGEYRRRRRCWARPSRESPAKSQEPQVGPSDPDKPPNPRVLCSEARDRPRIRVAARRRSGSARGDSYEHLESHRRSAETIRAGGPRQGRARCKGATWQIVHDSPYRSRWPPSTPTPARAHAGLVFAKACGRNPAGARPRRTVPLAPVAAAHLDVRDFALRPTRPSR